ncbi:toxin [Helicobacter brantae]|uniref:Toxin n=1 Tax=Helicobacter brantae TaxID=375927 RepID=A0A3D8J2T7_9HELI|nr:toxin [Helicobacter brantae]RDU71713.1 toxin [Helicobacter brantae]
MKKVYLALLLMIGLLYAQDPIEDLPDFTPQFSIRSLYSGDILISKKSSMPTPNWKIRDVTIPELAKSDFAEALFKLGYVQFYHPQDDNRCIGIDEAGFFTDRNCKQDIDSKKYETIFSIMPTNTGAVQIRSLVLDKNQCISVFHTTAIPRGRDFGINPCDFSALVLIDLKTLLILAPPLGEFMLNN